jgi:predicted glycoside hydrolase/deacetylase ChbG (UPF0249 family)
VARHLIVNADDFGASEGINRGILDCHTRGVVTSASLMVTGRAAAEAASIARDYPELSVGLHWDVWGEDEREFDTRCTVAVRAEFASQLHRFEDLMGGGPTHVDSHRHAHREAHLAPVFRELVEPLGVPLRGSGEVRFVGGFYAQWEWQVTDLDHVSVAALRRMIREEVADGWTEFSCHPGHVSPGYQAVYLAEREAEVATLTDPRIRETILECGVALASYRDYARSRSAQPAE